MERPFPLAGRRKSSPSASSDVFVGDVKFIKCTVYPSKSTRACCCHFFDARPTTKIRPASTPTSLYMWTSLVEPILVDQLI
uniref:Uncharacterized protein n=1 Tax=Romanomermis culicivorax TaxID=13658 RepID=A0A915IEH3_ROMCU